jgi:hypothetical protein
MNVDDSDPQPFDLKPLAAGQAVPAPGAPAVAQATPATPASPAAGATPQNSASGRAAVPAPAGAHPVGGVSNLQTGE